VSVALIISVSELMFFGPAERVLTGQIGCIIDPLAGLSLSNTKQHVERLGVQRSRTVIHNWVKQVDLQPTATRSSNYVAPDETVIQLGSERYWLYAAVNPDANEFLHVQLFPTTNSGCTLVFLRKIREKHDS
jgi:putative transposase